jgi:hypothetical protein
VQNGQNDLFSLFRFQSLRQQSLSLKAEGNEFYLKDRNDEANRKYSEALELCPLVFESERAVFFANRAAAKCKMVGSWPVPDKVQF